jgi:hypothetical protein
VKTSTSFAIIPQTKTPVNRPLYRPRPRPPQEASHHSHGPDPPRHLRHLLLPNREGHLPRLHRVQAIIVTKEANDQIVNPIITATHRKNKIVRPQTLRKTLQNGPLPPIFSGRVRAMIRITLLLLLYYYYPYETIKPSTKTLRHLPTNQIPNLATSHLRTR